MWFGVLHFVFKCKTLESHFVWGVLHIETQNEPMQSANCDATAVPKLSCRCLCLMTARLGLVLCGGGSGLGPQGATFAPSLCPSSSSSVRESVRGAILSCLPVSICRSVCCLEDTTRPLLWVSAGASEMAVDLSVSSVTWMSLVLLPSESSISAPMQLYTMLTRSVDCTKTKNGLIHESSNLKKWKCLISHTFFFFS